MDSKVIFLRKKIKGENSIEEVAKKVAKATGATIKECPYHSTSLKGIIGNIFFARKECGLINHIIAPTEAYLLPFIRNKKIITYHDLGTLYSSRNKIYKLLKVIFYIKPAEFFSDEVTFVSEFTKNDFIRQIWRKKLSTRVIYNSYDVRLIPNDKSMDEDIPIILHIGTAKRKNFDSVIEACDGLRVKLLVIGNLSEAQKELLKKYRIDYENYYDVDYDFIVTSYNRATLVTFPSSYEGFGIPIVEANAMGKVVISTDLPVIKEIGGNAVYYIKAPTVEQIRLAIETLLNNKSLRKEYEHRGLENCRRYKNEVIYEQYRNLYDSLTYEQQ